MGMVVCMCWCWDAYRSACALLAHVNGHISLQVDMHVLTDSAHADYRSQLNYKWLEAKGNGGL